MLPLFEANLPEGFHYRADVLTPDEERDLVDAIARVQFEAFEMRGVVARRRVAFFGASYDGPASTAPPIPEFLLPVRARMAEWLGVAPDDLAMALINEYRPGSPIGWHRDAPQYESVAGISLLSGCRMKLRPYVPPSAQKPGGSPRKATHEIILAPRSGYLITGPARREFEHSIPPVAALRYSITFRTLRRPAAAGGRGR